jgi:outer membrane scaffolding protein for murein synthesis (MipA/OmpV family)
VPLEGLSALRRRLREPSVGLGFSATGFLSTHWLINLDAAANRLRGSASESPITQRTNQYVAALSIAYNK